MEPIAFVTNKDGSKDPGNVNANFNQLLQVQDKLSFSAGELHDAWASKTKKVSMTKSGFEILPYVEKICSQSLEFQPGERFDNPKLIHQFKFRSLHSLITTFELDRKKASKVLCKAKAELISYRIQKGEPCRYDMMLSILWKNYKAWFRYFRKDHFYLFRDQYHISVSSSKKHKFHSFCLTEVCGLRFLTYHPILEIKIFDREQNHLLTIQTNVLASAECTSKFDDVRRRYELEFSQVKLNVNSSDDRLKDLFEKMINCMNKWEQTESRLKRDATENMMRKFSLTNSGHHSGFLSPQFQRIERGKNSFQTTKRRKGSWDLSRVERSPSFMNILKSPRNRSPRKSSKTPEDLIQEIHQMAAPLVGKWEQGDDIFDLFDQHLTEYTEYKDKPKYSSSLNKELNNMPEFIPIAKQAHELVAQFQYPDLDDIKLTRLSQLKAVELWNTPEFSTLLVSPMTSRRFLGPENMWIREKERPFRILKEIFLSIYHAGYCDRVMNQKTTKKTVDWMAELQAYRFLDKKDDPIQAYLFPVLERSLRMYELYQDLFPYLQQERSDYHLEETSSEPIIYSRKCKGEPEFRIESKQLHRVFTIELFKFPAKQRIAKLFFCETFSFEDPKICLRYLTIEKIDFSRGTSLKIVRYVIEKLLHSAKERCCLNRLQKNV